MSIPAEGLKLGETSHYFAGHANDGYLHLHMIKQICPSL